MPKGCGTGRLHASSQRCLTAFSFAAARRAGYPRDTQGDGVRGRATSSGSYLRATGGCTVMGPLSGARELWAETLGDPLLPAYRPAALRVGGRAGDAPPGEGAGAGPAQPAGPRRQARPGNHLPEVLAERPAEALCQRVGAGRGLAALPRRQTDPGAPGRPGRAGVALVPAQPVGGAPARRGGGLAAARHGLHVVLRDPGQQPGGRSTRQRTEGAGGKSAERPALVRRGNYPGPKGLGNGRSRFAAAPARRPRSARARRAGPARLRVVPLAAPVPAGHGHFARPRGPRPLRGVQPGRQAARLRRRQEWPTGGGQGLGHGDGTGNPLPARAQGPRVLRGFQPGRPAAGLRERGRAHAGRDQGLGRGRRTRAAFPARARHPRARPGVQPGRPAARLLRRGG